MARALTRPGERVQSTQSNVPSGQSAVTCSETEPLASGPSTTCGLDGGGVRFAKLT